MLKCGTYPQDIVFNLKKYTGEESPTVEKPNDKRRMFANEFTKEEQNTMIKWLTKHQSLIVSDILKGRGRFAAEWMLVAQKTERNARWILKSMNFCMNYFGNGAVEITMQRKGGDGGRKTATVLQFKINPGELFDVE